MILLVILGFIIFVVLSSSKKWSRTSKGNKGEHRIAKILFSLSANEYKVLNDIMLCTKNGRTTQIDHVVVSCYGIFVIETKNYSGWIFGKENAEYWTQVIYKVKYKFRNPVKQNQAHVLALKDLLAEYKNIAYFPIVAFAGNAELKNVQSKTPVIYSKNLLRLIHSNSISKCLTETEIHKITELLLSSNIVDKTARAEHVQTIQQTVVDRKIKIENLICPRCSAELKLRNGRNGKFYGCSNYPNCRFTMPY